MSITLVTTSGKRYTTQLNFQSIQALTKAGNLVCVDGENGSEYINPHTIEKIIGDAPKPVMSLRVSNFHVPTEQEQKEAQAKMQPLKAIFDEKAKFMQELRKAELGQINSQNIYGAIREVKEEVKEEVKQRVKEINETPATAVTENVLENKQEMINQATKPRMSKSPEKIAKVKTNKTVNTKFKINPKENR